MPKNFSMVGLVSIQVEVGKFDEVVEDLKAIDEVMEVYGAYGEVDIVTKVEARGEYLSEVVFKKIRSIGGVVDTNTLVLIPL